MGNLDGDHDECFIGNLPQRIYVATDAIFEGTSSPVEVETFEVTLLATSVSPYGDVIVSFKAPTPDGGESADSYPYMGQSHIPPYAIANTVALETAVLDAVKKAICERFV